MQQQRWFRALWLLIPLLLVTFSLAQAQQSQPVFRIGVLDAELGRSPMAHAWPSLASTKRAACLMPTDTNFRLELVVQPVDQGSSLNEPVTALAEAGVVAVIGPETNELVLSALPQLQSLRVPILTPAIGDTLVASDTSGLVFRTRAAERWQGAALADYLGNTLNVGQVLTVQLDRNSTASRVGFSIALGQLPNPPRERTLLLDENTTINDLVSAALNSGTAMVVTYGPPELAVSFYTGLRSAGYVGVFAYNDALNPVFNDSIPFSELRGILGTTTWAFSSINPLSNAFLNDFVRGYAYVPGEAEAASYDAVFLLAAALGRQGNLLNNIAAVSNLEGVQGLLSPGDD
ncbi:amino acid ABC transporter substrate-binding protein [bacterium]|nr:amino acid ABC transporter substrate-binding protein [bacterium]